MATFSVMYQNVRGLRTKLVEFKTNLATNSPDIIFITESWLKDGILDHVIVDTHLDTVLPRQRLEKIGWRRRMHCSEK